MNAPETQTVEEMLVEAIRASARIPENIVYDDGEDRVTYCLEMSYQQLDPEKLSLTVEAWFAAKHAAEIADLKWDLAETERQVRSWEDWDKLLKAEHPEIFGDAPAQPAEIAVPEPSSAMFGQAARYATAAPESSPWYVRRSDGSLWPSDKLWKHMENAGGEAPAPQPSPADQTDHGECGLTCSFCRKNGVEIIVMSNGFICAECVEFASAILKMGRGQDNGGQP